VNANVFKPSVDMTFSAAHSDRQRLLQFCRENDQETLHLDLSEVTHCDSAGLALLIEAKRLCIELNKTLSIAGMPKAIHALAEFCGVGAMLENKV
jgi:phospholipid transport system transporter-binding protein